MAQCWNLSDDFNWREFDRHFGDDQPEEEYESDFDPTDGYEDDTDIREYWINRSSLVEGK